MLKTMTEKQRRVFVLYYRHGYTLEEIGKMEGISKQSVFYRLDGALSRLRKYYSNNQ